MSASFTRLSGLWTVALLSLAVTAPAQSADLEAGRKTFEEICAACHGATGRPDEVVDALGFDDFARTLRRERIYFANQPADAALMAQYPVVQQEELTAPPGVRGVSLRGREPGLSAQARERTLSERAGDEFD